MTNYIENIKTPDSILHSLGGYQLDTSWNYRRITVIAGSNLNGNQTVSYDLSSILTDKACDYEVMGVVFLTSSVNGQQPLLSVWNKRKGIRTIVGGQYNRNSTNINGVGNFCIRISASAPTIVITNDRNFVVSSVWAIVTYYRKLGRNV